MSDARGFDAIIGQAVAKRSLRKAIRDSTPSHAYVFLGADGVGKCTTAVEFAKALNCLQLQDYRACGDCTNCRSLDHGNFPDVRIWSPNGKNTTIDQMREMRDLASFSPLIGRWKVNIVEQGDTLNEESANCILKLLEEPPDYLINIILYRNAAAVLSTIRSRCRIVRFLQVPVSELAQSLSEDYGCPKTEAQFLAAYSQGCPGKAIRLIGDTAFFERRDEIAAVVGKVAENPWLALRLAEVLHGASARVADDADDDSDEDQPSPAAATPKRGKREATLESLDVLTSWYSDLLAVSVRGAEADLIHADKRDDVLRHTRQYQTTSHIASCITAIMSARTAVAANANPQIATEALMIQLSGL